MGRYYKVLQDNGVAPNGPDGFRWSLPRWKGPKSNGRWIPGDWMPTVPNPRLCERGYHACTRSQLIDFLNYGLHIYVIELRGEIVTGTDKVVASEARLVEELPWGNDAARLFAVECAADVIHLMNDDRSIAALEVAFENGCGTASAAELDAARAAARDAAWAAAGDAAWGAAWAAARGAAGDAAWDAAWAAARDAAWAAAWDAVGAAARQKQTDRLMWWLGED